MDDKSLYLGTLEEAIDAVNLVKERKNNGEEVSREELINLTINLIRAFFSNGINEGIIATILFGEYSYNDGLIRYIFGNSTPLKLESSESRTYDYIKCGSATIFGKDIWDYNVIYMNAWENETDIRSFSFTMDELTIDQAGISLYYNDDGLVDKRVFRKKISSDVSIYYPNYHVERLFIIVRDQWNPDFVHTSDCFMVLNERRKVILNRSQSKNGFVSPDAFFDLRPNYGLMESRLENVMNVIDDRESCFKFTTDLTYYFPNIRKAFIDRVSESERINKIYGYRRKRKK